MPFRRRHARLADQMVADAISRCRNHMDCLLADVLASTLALMWVRMQKLVDWLAQMSHSYHTIVTERGLKFVVSRTSSIEHTEV